jgi:arylsulfatase A-like enzyme
VFILKRVPFLITAVFLLLSVLSCQLVIEKPNIIIILADDLGYGDLSCYNPQSLIRTPNIDRLANAGIHFTDAHSPSSVCTPTRYALLTGRYAWRGTLKKGVIEGPHIPLLEEERTTIAGMLKKQGYVTGVFGKWHVGMTFQNETGQAARTEDGKNQLDIDFTKGILNGPQHHGFDYSVVTPGCPTDYYFNFWVENNIIRGPVYYSEEKEWMESADWQHETVDTLITSKTLSFIKDHMNNNPEQPFFAFMALSVPHIPWLPPEFTKGKSAAGPRGDQVVLADWCVAQVEQLLNDLNISDNTLLIFTSDNGPREGINGHKSAGDLRGYKGSIWEGGHRIPFIAKWPVKIKPQTKSDQLITLADLTATFAAIVGDESPVSAEDSYNILPALLGNDNNAAIHDLAIHHSGNGVFAISKGDWKLIYESEQSGYGNDPQPGGAGQLYNLKDDPAESNNLYGKEPERVTKMIEELKKVQQGNYR